MVRNAAKSTHLQDAIKSLKNVHVVEADVVDHISLEACSPASRLRCRVTDIVILLQQAAQRVSELSGGTLDYLIHNAAHISDELFEGYETLWAAFSDFIFQHHSSVDVFAARTWTSSMPRPSPQYVTHVPNPLEAHRLARQFKVNALGVVHGVSAFLPLLRARPTKKIIVIGAAGADLKCIRSGGMADLVAYSMTKAAAHVAATKWALHLKDEGFVVITLSPGMVDTTETNVSGESRIPCASPDESAILTWKKYCTSDRPAPGVELDAVFKERGWVVKLQTMEESVVAQLKVIDNLKPEDNGLFLAHDTGKEYTV